MNIFKVITGNIVKWWQLTILPILRIDNNNSIYRQSDSPQPDVLNQQAPPVSNLNAGEKGGVPVQASPAVEEKTSSVNAPVQEMTDAQLVMERINREREEKRKKDMEKAQEEARLAAIMNANKVDVNAFIQAGKEAREGKEKEENVQGESGDAGTTGVEPDAMARAEEIIARLNREAAEDEAKKRAEIEEAKKQAKETFGV